MHGLLAPNESRFQDFSAPTKPHIRFVLRTVGFSNNSVSSSHSRVLVSLLNSAGEILIFCGSFGRDCEFRDGTEIRGNREKIDREVSKMGSAGEFRRELGLTKS